MNSKLKMLFSVAMLLIVACGNQKEKEIAKKDDNVRIVSLSGTTSEILCALGMEDKIVGVDVTSTYPQSVVKLPKVGHNRNISAESIIALKPTLVIGIAENIKPELTEQLKSANIKVLLYHLDNSVAGTKSLIKHIADSLGKSAAVQALSDNIDKDLKEVLVLNRKIKILFIYARGAGTMMVAGNHTSATAMISIAGAENAVNDFEDFKPLTPESLLKANPDEILMFDSGLQSLGGMDGLLKVPGVSQTNAGKNKQVIEMDGQLLTGFGPRVGQAAAALSKKINEIKTN